MVCLLIPSIIFQLNLEASDFLKELQNKLNSVMDDLSRIFAVRWVCLIESYLLIPTYLISCNKPP